MHICLLFLPVSSVDSFFFSFLSFYLKFPRVGPLATCKEDHVRTLNLPTQHGHSGTLSGLLLCGGGHGSFVAFEWRLKSQAGQSLEELL